MPKYFWPIFGTITSIIVALSVWLVLRQNSASLAQLSEELAQARTEALTSQAQLSGLTEKLADSAARIAALEQEKAAAAQAHKGLEDEMRAALESKGVTISELQGKLTVNILDRILFDSGEAILKPDGESVLQKIAAILSQHPKLTIHVIGHTDNVPIRAGARARFASNWELSTARALAAVRFLTEKAGVDPQHLGAVGYGEFRPIADNSTPEGRARNRRIAITILPDELVGSDAVPGTRTNALSASLPLNATTNSSLSSRSTIPDDVSVPPAQ